MSDSSTLRQKAREAIQTGRLPKRQPAHVWGGAGAGACCAICGKFTTACGRRPAALMFLLRLRETCFVSGWELPVTNECAQSADGRRREPKLAQKTGHEMPETSSGKLVRADPDEPWSAESSRHAPPPSASLPNWWKSL